MQVIGKSWFDSSRKCSDKPKKKKKVKVVNKAKFSKHTALVLSYSLGMKNGFYDTKEWKQLRYSAFEKYGKKCACCESTTGPFHIDHIKPRSHFPKLELSISNLQVLCEACNIGKSNDYYTDWR